MGIEKLHKQPSGRLVESLKMERVRTILTHGYPYPHKNSRHFMIRKTIKPDYSNFSRWYVAWIFLAALYHLPSFQSMGLDLRMNISLFLAVYISSLVFFIVFHVILLGLWYLGLVSRMAEKKPEMLTTIIQNCAVISIACSVFYDHCGNRTLSRDKSFDLRTARWVAFSLWRKQNEDNALISKWAIYGEMGSKPLTHPLPISEYENLNKLLKPDFEDTVPQYSGTSTDLHRTVFNLMISVTLFVGRFDMRMMQAAMNKGPDESKSSDLLYDHLDGKDKLLFDFMADAGNGGNSAYAIARLYFPVKNY